jgi:hypothetical protein
VRETSGCAGTYQAVQGYIRLYRYISGCAGTYQAVQGHISLCGAYQAGQGYIRLCRDISGRTRAYRAVQRHLMLCRDIPSCAGTYQAVLGYFPDTQHCSPIGYFMVERQAVNTAKDFKRISTCDVLLCTNDTNNNSQYQCQHSYLYHTTGRPVFAPRLVWGISDRRAGACTEICMGDCGQDSRCLHRDLYGGLR